MGLLSQEQQTIAAATAAAAVAAVACCHGVNVAGSRRTTGDQLMLGALPGGELLPQPCAPREPKYASLCLPLTH
jgi:hypothetical protein